MSQTTQCPSCQTKFKVSDAHLALAGGMVRCGRCSHVFHAPSYAEAPAAPAAPAQPVAPRPEAPLSAAMDDDFELELPDFQPGPPAATATITPPPAPASTPDDFADLPDFDLLDDAPAPEPAKPAAPRAASAEIAPDFRGAAAAAEASRKEVAEFQQALAEALRPPAANSHRQRKLDAYQAAPDEDTEEDNAAASEPPAPPAAKTERIEPVFRASDREHDDADDNPPAAATVADTGNEATSSALRTTLLALLATVLTLLLLGQLVFINRTRVSAEAPELRPALEAVCAAFSCTVPLPTDRQLIRTEWSELSFVPQNEQLIQLNATLKNLARYPQAFPVMELTLKDGEDKVVARKAFRPEEYVPAEDWKLGQFNANSELKLQLRMAMTQGKALGYSLHFYYP